MSRFFLPVCYTAAAAIATFTVALTIRDQHYDTKIQVLTDRYFRDEIRREDFNDQYRRLQCDQNKWRRFIRVNTWMCQQSDHGHATGLPAYYNSLSDIYDAKRVSCPK